MRYTLLITHSSAQIRVSFETSLTRMAEETQKSEYDNLPVDVLTLIGSTLLAKDRICFRSVCKTWRSAITPIPSPPLQLTESLTSFATITPFPLLMYYGYDDSFPTFYHPIYNTTFTINSPEIVNAMIRFSKDGWLLMSRGEHEIFFYNPILNQKIHIPPLDDQRGYYRFLTVSFSSVPTSADCTVFGVIYSASNSIKFSFIRIGEDEWTTCTVKKKGIEFTGSLSNPVFHNGVFYYLDRKGLLGTFDPTQESGEDGWTVLAKPNQPCNSIFRNYLIECQGELISVFMGHVGKWIKIYKLDFATMTWKELKSLGHRALFVTRTASLSTTNLKQEIMGMRNKIFFPRFHRKSYGGIFYSLDSCKFHTMDSGYNSNNFYGTAEKLFCTWIDPS